MDQTSNLEYVAGSVCDDSSNSTCCPGFSCLRTDAEVVAGESATPQTCHPQKEYPHVLKNLEKNEEDSETTTSSTTITWIEIDDDDYNN